MAEPHVQSRMQSADKNDWNAGRQPSCPWKIDANVSRLMRLPPAQTITPVIIGRKGIG